MTQTWSLSPELDISAADRNRGHYENMEDSPGWAPSCPLSTDVQAAVFKRRFEVFYKHCSLAL